MRDYPKMMDIRGSGEPAINYWGDGAYDVDWPRSFSELPSTGDEISSTDGKYSAVVISVVRGQHSPSDDSPVVFIKIKRLTEKT